MTWDPDVYLRWADHRTRPGRELIARIPPGEPETGIDLGCGTGHLTVLLADRFPTLSLTGLDASGEMLERAPTHPRIEWRIGAIEEWEPPTPLDLVFSNAALHWVDDHASLFPRLSRAVAKGGTLAVQMPANFSQPTHTVPASVLDDGDWPEEARAALARDRVAPPEEYRGWIGRDFEVDLWTTTYRQVLTGPDPVLDWVSGSVLRPVLATLDEERSARFRAACAAGYRTAYPPGPDGTTVLPFTRSFVVARRR